MNSNKLRLRVRPTIFIYSYFVYLQRNLGVPGASLVRRQGVKCGERGGRGVVGAAEAMLLRLRVRVLRSILR